jgi:signal transduction histidine kinase
MGKSPTTLPSKKTLASASGAEALRQYAEQLAAQNAELDAFAHTVAHDLKSPICVIIGFAEMLSNDRENMSPKETSEALRLIAQTAEKINTIIEELMLLAGVRKQEIIPEPLDMGSVVQAATERLQMLVQDRRAQITLLDETTWPVALGYAPWVEEVWANYLSNAIKYGGRPPEIQVGATVHADGQARFWMRDNGPGLRPETQSSLFTPFTRLDQVRAKGHGLGLSIVRRIVEKLGGTVGVESKIGQGSVFYFTLPLASS